MFFPNDVLAYAQPPGRVVRILWIDEQARLAVIYELSRAQAGVRRRPAPQTLPLQTLVDDARARRARLLLDDPWRAPVGAALSDKQRRQQLRAWDAVRSLHEQLPALYQQRPRMLLVAAYCREHGLSTSAVMRYLRRYWERGQTVDALAPDYANSGARGGTRNARVGVKRGRPRKGGPAGPNADAALRAVFQAAAARYLTGDARMSRLTAYRRMLADEFRDADPASVPSYGQFMYWLRRDQGG
jgi:hypothetical protein